MYQVLLTQKRIVLHPTPPSQQHGECLQGYLVPWLAVLLEEVVDPLYPLDRFPKGPVGVPSRNGYPLDKYLLLFGPVEFCRRWPASMVLLGQFRREVR